jgi:hypothetical protein
MTRGVIEGVSGDLGTSRQSAADIAIPVLPDGSFARAYVTLETHGPDHGPTAPCRHVDRWRVVFGLDHGRRDSAPVGPAFAQPEEASAFARLLNGRPDGGAVEAAGVASDQAAGGVTRGVPADHTTEGHVAPSPGPAAGQEGPCAVCGTPLRPTAQHRRTCSARGRQRLRRGRWSGALQLTLDLSGPGLAASDPIAVGEAAR